MTAQAAAPSEQRKTEWAGRVETFARDAAPKTVPYAQALLALVAPEPGARVLDVASGSGVAAVAAAKLVGPEGAVLATDFVPEWAPYVAETVAAAGVANVTFAVMPAEALDVPEASFDVVLCQFGLMFVADPVQVLRGMRRALRPGGKLGLVVWSVPEKVGLFLIPGMIGAALPPVPDGPPSPLGLSAPGLIEGLVAEAGFRDIVVERVTRSYEVANGDAEWRRWSEDASSPMVRGLATLSAAEREALRTKAVAALERFRDGDVLRIRSEAILVTAAR